MPKKDKFEDPTFDNPLADAGGVPYEPGDDRPRSKVALVLQQQAAQLMAIPGVKSIGEGSGPVGNPAIEVGVTHSGVAQSVPRILDGIVVVTRVVGEVDAYAQKTRHRP